MKILMVLTSHDQLGNTGRKTGFWLEDFVAPYFVFRDVENELLRLGAIFEKEANWHLFSVVDGRLITGQNPSSSTVAAEDVIGLLAQRAA